MPEETTRINATVPNGWGPWAMKLIFLVVTSLLAYSTVSAERLQTKLADLQTHHAVEEERWRTVEKRLEKIEASLDTLTRRK